MLTLWKHNFFVKSSMTSRSQTITFLFKNSLFLLFMLLIDWRNKCRWTLWKNKVWLIQRWHLPCKKTKFAFQISQPWLTFLWTTFCPCFKIFCANENTFWNSCCVGRNLNFKIHIFVFFETSLIIIYIIVHQK